MCAYRGSPCIGTHPSEIVVWQRITLHYYPVITNYIVGFHGFQIQWFDGVSLYYATKITVVIHRYDAQVVQPTAIGSSSNRHKWSVVHVRSGWAPRRIGCTSCAGVIRHHNAWSAMPCNQSWTIGGHPHLKQMQTISNQLRLLLSQQRPVVDSQIPAMTKNEDQLTTPTFLLHPMKHVGAPSG